MRGAAGTLRPFEFSGGCDGFRRQFRRPAKLAISL
jgi:hypothetical protein